MTDACFVSWSRTTLTKDVAFILQDRMGHAAATHVIDNMAVVIDLLFDETPPDEVAFALHTAITETAH